MDEDINLSECLTSFDFIEIDVQKDEDSDGEKWKPTKRVVK